MKEFLDRFLPRLFPKLEFLCVPHEGKSDLEKSIPRKLRAWIEPGVRFVVVRDNDGAQCGRVKKKLLRLCSEANRDDTLVRLACQELEAWYFGEAEALAEVYGQPDLRKLPRQARYRDPDKIVNPSSALEDLVPGFGKISGARRMGEIISTSIDRNGSHSFRVFIDGVSRIAAELQQA